MLYCEPWHGHLNFFSALFHGTTQPRWVQTALRPKLRSSCLSSRTIRYVGSACSHPSYQAQCPSEGMLHLAPVQVLERKHP